MGNRAVISFDGFTDNSIGIYLHWNGGRDSVEGFLLAARELSNGDAQYNRARLVEAIGVFFEGGLSVGLDYVKNLDCDNWDNGVYVVDTGKLEIIERRYFEGQEQAHHNPREIADEILARVNRGLVEEAA